MHGNKVARKIEVSVPGLNMKVGIVVYEPTVIGAPPSAPLRGRGITDLRVDDNEVIKVAAKFEFEYEPGIRDDVERYIVSRLSNIDQHYKELGLTVSREHILSEKCRYIEVEVKPRRYLPAKAVFREVADSFPELVVDAVVAGVKDICYDREVLNCAIKLKERLGLGVEIGETEDERNLATA